MTAKNLINGIGWFLLLAYWGLTIVVLADSDLTGMVMFTIFMPFLAIPMGIIANLFFRPGWAIFCAIWLIVGFWLVSIEE